jgi:hypothetical protein
MTQQIINLGTGPDTSGSDSRYTAFDKAKSNFAELYGMVGTVGSAAISTKTGAYTFALVDVGTVVEGNSASSLDFTVPPNSSVAFAVGSVLEVRQIGAGQVTIVPGSGVTLRTPSSLTTRTAWSSVSLHKRATNEWVVAGDTA